ncbi:DUF2735 domain-containing protein [Methylobacterium oryzihabitans]|uniref:DUF2735 domain-containing protein n=1 Tax=Methylobacterium oryzihabitans TaxID=2499852 RepID=A0A3S2VIW6_9HYPH|nr:DUF2735 domain-containing protein [Methylobacterium oryzihabitans]RVU13965.1 DUF2735 domain-containing protein [Methylobacterium oryzihabitans]
MSTSTQRHTAKIYQFPVRGTAAARAAGKAVAAPAQTYADAAFGSGWYHEAAIQDAVRAGKP